MIAPNSTPPSDWTIAGTGDFNGNGRADILWRNSLGGVGLWLMNSDGTIKSTPALGSLPLTDWTIVGKRSKDALKPHSAAETQPSHAANSWHLRT
jgi:hypothetical protein